MCHTFHQELANGIKLNIKCLILFQSIGEGSQKNKVVQVILSYSYNVVWYNEEK